MNLTNYQRIKTLIDIKGTTADNLLKQIVSSVSLELQSSPLFNREVEFKERTKQFDSQAEQKVLSLPAFPIDKTLTTKVWHDIDRVFSSELDTDNYYIDEDTGLLYFDNYTISEGKGSIKVQWSGGLAKSVDNLLGTITGKTGTYQAGETITGNLSNAEGILVSQANGNISILVTRGTFIIGDVLAGGTSLATSTLATITQIPLVMSNPDLSYACELQCAFIYQRRDNLALRSISVQGASIQTYQTLELLPEVKRILENYRRITI